MLYLHCLVWLKKVLYLPNLCAKIQGNKGFCMRLLAFFEHIIKYFINNDIFSNVLHHICIDMHKANTTENFMAYFKKDSKPVVKKV